LQPNKIKQKTYNKLYISWKHLKDGDPLKEKIEMEMQRLKHEIDGKVLIICNFCPTNGCLNCNYIEICGLINIKEYNRVKGMT